MAREPAVERAACSDICRPLGWLPGLADGLAAKGWRYTLWARFAPCGLDPLSLAYREARAQRYRPADYQRGAMLCPLPGHRNPHFPKVSGGYSLPATLATNLAT